MSKKKGHRGPEPTCPWSEQLKELKKHKHSIFYESGEVTELVQHKKLWTAISKNLRTEGYKINAKTLQSNVAQDRHALKTDLLNELKRDQEVNKQTVSVSEMKDEPIPHITSTNVLERLLKLQNDALLKPMIKEFSPFKFCVSFWSNDAIRLAKFSKSELFVFGEIGTFTENFSVPEQFNSEKIMTYSLGIISDENEFVPLFHIMLEEETNAHLKKFAKEILRAGCPPPVKILVDYRRNHLKAVTESFNTNYCYERYVATNYLCLTEKSNSIILPRCQIIVDIGIILQIVKSTWLFQPPDLSEYLSDFFIDAIKLLHSKSSLHDFEKTLKKILVLTTHQFESKLTQETFEELAIEFQQLSNEKCNCNFNYENIHLEKNEEKVDFRQCKEIIDYLTKLYKQACPSKPENSLERKNSFYGMVNTDHILKLCIEFVTWTHVMDDAYGTKNLQSSTSILQVYRDIFLESVSDVTLPFAIDDYIKRKITFTENNISRVGVLKGLSCNPEDDPLIVDLEGEDSYLTYAENYMGLNSISDESNKGNNSSESTKSENSSNSDNSIENLEENSKHELLNEDQILKKCRKTLKPKKRGPTLEPCPDFFVYMKLPKKIAKKRSVIQNANSPGLKTDQLILTSSGFDSFSEIFVSSFYLIYKFQKLLQNKCSRDFFNIIADYAKDLKLKSFYQERERFLIQVLNGKFRNKLYWSASLAEFLELLVTPSIKKTLQCEACGEIMMDDCSTLKLLFSNVADLSNNVDQNLLFSPVSCRVCGCLMNVKITLENYLIIDVETYGKDSTVKNINTLPADISIDSKRFALTGVISHTESLIEPYVRHYSAHCLKWESKSEKRIWQTFDDTCKRYKIEKKKAFNVEPAILIFIEYDTARTQEKNEAQDNKIYKGITIDNQDDEITIELEAVNNDLKDTHDTSYIIDTYEQMCSKEQNSNIEIECTDNAQMITSTPDNSAMIISISENSSMNISAIDENQKSNTTCETRSIKEISECDKIVNDILKIDRENAILPDKEKDKTIFSFDDINKAELAWENPQIYTTEIIANANSQGKIQFKIGDSKHLLKFKNTCSIDSITESLKHCYMTDEAFRNDIEGIENKNDLLSAIRNYILSQDMNEFYFNRAKSMFIRVPSVKHALLGYVKNCKMNLCSLFREIMSQYPSITFSGTCTCRETQERKFITREIDYKIFFNNGISRIGQMLEESLQLLNMHCLKQNCHKKIEELEVTLGNYVAFDMELIYESVYQATLAKMTGIYIKNFHTPLQDIPQYITFFQSKYSLKAVIEFQELSPTFLHYIAYCRSSDNRWTMYDDTSVAAKELNSRNLPAIKISLIIYTAMRQ